MVRVIVYEPHYDAKHREVLRAFAEGAARDPGANVRVKDARDFAAGEADVAVVFGWYKTAYAPSMPKLPIIQHPGHRLLVIESGFQLRGTYYQAGWGGFAGHADHRAAGAGTDRFYGMGLALAPWRVRDGPTVVVGQVPWDTQVQDVDHAAWCRRVVKWLLNADKDVLFRPHPRVKGRGPDPYGMAGMAPTDEGKLAPTLKRAARVVTYNSTTAVDAVLAGIPTVAMDAGSMAWGVSSHRLGDPPATPDRTAWAARLGYSQWTRDEMAEGLAWVHLSR